MSFTGRLSTDKICQVTVITCNKPILTCKITDEQKGRVEWKQNIF